MEKELPSLLEQFFFHQFGERSDRGKTEFFRGALPGSREQSIASEATEEKRSFFEVRCPEAIIQIELTHEKEEQRVIK